MCFCYRPNRCIRHATRLPSLPAVLPVPRWPWRGPAVRRQGRGLHTLSPPPCAGPRGASRRTEHPSEPRDERGRAMARAAAGRHAGRLRGEGGERRGARGRFSLGPGAPGDTASLCRRRTDAAWGRGPRLRAGLHLSAAALGERPGPPATPASASSPSVPCLLPPPGGRPAARAGRAGGRARLKGVAGGEVWRRLSGAWAPRQHHGGAGRVAGPRPAAPAGARARRPGRRLAHLQGRLRAAGGDRSVERGRGGAEVGRKAGMSRPAPGLPALALPQAGLAHCGGRTRHCSGGCCKLYPPGSGRPRGAAAPARTRRAPPGAARRRCRCPAVHRHSSLDLRVCAGTPATPQMRSVCFVCLRCVCPWMRTCACIHSDYSAFFRRFHGGGRSHP